MDKQHTQGANAGKFKSFLREIVRRKYWVAAIVIAGLAIVWIYAAAQPVIYNSTASLLIDDFTPDQHGKINADISADVVQAHRVLAESRLVRERAVKLAQEALGEPATATVGDFQTHADGPVVYLKVFDTDPKRAAAYANAWSDVVLADAKGTARKWEQAVGLTRPSLPNWKRNLAAAGFLCVAFGVLSIIASAAWNRHRRMIVPG